MMATNTWTRRPGSSTKRIRCMGRQEDLNTLDNQIANEVPFDPAGTAFDSWQYGCG